MIYAKPQYPELYDAAQTAQGRVIGHQEVTNEAQARVMTALIRAYGNAPRCLIYAEPTIAASDMAPDIVLAHPEIGLLIFEVKAYDMPYIQGMEAGNLKIRQNGEVVEVNPLRQAQRGMYAIKESYEQLAADFTRPLFNAMVVLPNIMEKEWISAGYEGCIQRRLALFLDDLTDAEKIRARVSKLVHHTLSLSGLSETLPASAEATLYRVFGHATVLNKTARKVRPFQVENLGTHIDALEARTRQLSPEQQQLARQETWGHPFLVRGVAGSGKSSVLAYQVAWTVLRHERLHQQLTLFAEDRHPLPKIAVIGLSRSLVPFLQNMIHVAYQEIAGKELPPGVVQVHHLYGLLFQLAQEHDYFHYLHSAKSKEMGDQAREYLAQLDVMTPARLDALRFDAIWIDEGQDFHPEMFTLLHMLVRPDKQTGERTISIFYDDAQNIYGHPRPIWNTFGMNVEGGRAAFMHTAYRNSREIIELGMNVLLGTAADEQTRVQTRRFADVYTLKEKDLLAETPQGWRVQFAEAAGEIPQVKVFQNRTEQIDWLAGAVVHLIEEEKVRPEDILLLAGNANAFPYLEQSIRAASENRIEPRLVGGKNRSTLDEPLLLPGQLTISTIYAAKGYDAPIAFVLDVDQLDRNATGRSLFYVGVTRAKRYLIVTGVKHPGSLLHEAQTVHHLLFE